MTSIDLLRICDELAVIKSAVILCKDNDDKEKIVIDINTVMADLRGYFKDVNSNFEIELKS